MGLPPLQSDLAKWARWLVHWEEANGTLAPEACELAEPSESVDEIAGTQAADAIGPAELPRPPEQALEDDDDVDDANGDADAHPLAREAVVHAVVDAGRSTRAVKNRQRRLRRQAREFVAALELQEIQTARESVKKVDLELIGACEIELSLDRIVGRPSRRRRRLAWCAASDGMVGP